MVKRIGIAVVVLILSVTIWSTVRNQNAGRESADGQLVSEQIEPTQLASEVPQDQFPTLEPTHSEAGSITDDAEESDACEELARELETSRWRLHRAPEAIESEQGCRATLRLVTGATIPALPGISGFEVRDLADLSPARILANEPDNPAWAREMEARILGEVQNVVDFPLLTLHTVCRSTMCGLVLVYNNAVHDGSSYNALARQLAERLEFGSIYAGYTVDSGTRSALTMIYFGETDAPGMYNTDTEFRTPPSSFEAALEQRRETDSRE